MFEIVGRNDVLVQVKCNCLFINKSKALFIKLSIKIEKEKVVNKKRHGNRNAFFWGKKRKKFLKQHLFCPSYTGEHCGPLASDTFMT